MLRYKEYKGLGDVLNLPNERANLVSSSFQVCEKLAMESEALTDEEKKALEEILDKFTDLINVAADMAYELDNLHEEA